MIGAIGIVIGMGIIGLIAGYVFWTMVYKKDKEVCCSAKLTLSIPFVGVGLVVAMFVVVPVIYPHLDTYESRVEVRTAKIVALQKSYLIYAHKEGDGGVALRTLRTRGFRAPNKIRFYEEERPDSIIKIKEETKIATGSRWARAFWRGMPEETTYEIYLSRGTLKELYKTGIK